MNIFRKRDLLTLPCFPADLDFFILLSVFQLCSTPPFFLSIPSYQRLTREDQSGKPYVCLSLLFLSVSVFNFYCLCSCKLIFPLFPVYTNTAFMFFLFLLMPSIPKSVIHVLLFCPKLQDFRRVTLLFLCLGFAVQSGNDNKK